MRSLRRNACVDLSGDGWSWSDRLFVLRWTWTCFEVETCWSTWTDDEPVMKRICRPSTHDREPSPRATLTFTSLATLFVVEQRCSTGQSGWPVGDRLSSFLCLRIMSGETWSTWKTTGCRNEAMFDLSSRANTLGVDIVWSYLMLLQCNAGLWTFVVTPLLTDFGVRQSSSVFVELARELIENNTSFVEDSIPIHRSRLLSRNSVEINIRK